VHRNLAIYFIHGQDTLGDQRILTLEEALKQNLVVVYETGSVQRLAVANRSGDASVYIEAGEVVKGGKQDRVISTDMLLPPRSGKVPIGSFCVEESRWRRRGAERVDRFESASGSLVSRELKLAMKRYANQGEVWSKVAEAQQKLRRATGASAQSRHARGRYLAQQLRDAAQRPQNREWRESSLQLTLERSSVRAAISDYLRALKPLLDKNPDAVGFAFAINGKFNCAEVYASRALFRKLYPKHLAAAATEAVAEYQHGKRFEHPAPRYVETCLAQAQPPATPRKQEKLGSIVVATPGESRVLVFDECVGRPAGQSLHRSYICEE